MSGGMLLSAALARVAALPGSPRMKGDCSAALRRCHGGFLQLVYESGLDAGWPERTIVERGLAVTFQYCAVQVADDLSDGDCGYLTNPWRDGPTLLLGLHNLFLWNAARAGIPSAALARAAERLSEVGSSQYDELSTKRWTAAQATRVACGLNGAQHAAYLELLWAGSPLQAIASRAGYDLGLLVHVATDATTRDQRFWSLSARERRRLTREALAAARRLSAHRLPSLCRVAAAARSALR